MSDHIGDNSIHAEVVERGELTQCLLEWSCSCGVSLGWGTPLHDRSVLQRDPDRMWIEIEGAILFELSPWIKKHLGTP